MPSLDHLLNTIYLVYRSVGHTNDILKYLYKYLGEPMVYNTKLPPEIKNLLESNIRKKILLILYDDTEKSAYSITKHKDINISISTVIEHLQKLEKAGLIEVRDATKGKLKRYHYKITKKGKHYLQEYYNAIFDEVTEYISIDEITNSFNTIMVLKTIIDDEYTNAYEIAKKIGLSYKTVNNILWNLIKTRSIIEMPSDRIKSEVSIKKYKIMINKEDLEKIIQHYKNAENEIKKGQKILIINQKIITEKPKRNPFGIKP